MQPVLTWCLALVCHLWILLIGAAAGPAYALLYTLGLVCAGLLIRAAWHAAVSRQRKVGITAPLELCCDMALVALSRGRLMHTDVSMKCLGLGPATADNSRDCKQFCVCAR